MDYLRNAAARSRSNPPQKRRAPSQQHEPSPPPAARSNDDLPASDPRQQRLAALERLSQQLSKLKQDFRPPTGLTFQRTATAANPKLDFEPLNAPVLGYDEALLKLMIALDGVESEGDVVVREARKKIVREVDRELARLDRLRREAFENGGRVTLQQGEQEEQGAKEKQLREQKEKVDRMLQSAGATPAQLNHPSQQTMHGKRDHQFPTEPSRAYQPQHQQQQQYTPTSRGPPPPRSSEQQQQRYAPPPGQPPRRQPQTQAAQGPPPTGRPLDPNAPYFSRLPSRFG